MDGRRRRTGTGRGRGGGNAQPQHPTQGNIPLQIPDPRYFVQNPLSDDPAPADRIIVNHPAQVPMINNPAHPTWIAQANGPQPPAPSGPTPAQGTKPRPKSEKPTTKSEYLAKGAIQKPADGKNAKRLGEKCTNCIDGGSSCHGQRVLNGKCNSCRGIGQRISKRTGKLVELRQRDCHWIEPAKDIWTWPDAQRYYDLRKIPQNTTKGRATRKAKKAKEQKEAQATRQPSPSTQSDETYRDESVDEPSIHDFTVGSSQYRAAQLVAETMFHNGFVTSDSARNMQAASDTAAELYRRATEDVEEPDTFGLRTRIGALRAVFYSLAGMLERDEVLTQEDIRRFLP